jgi:hypothetical protein
MTAQPQEPIPRSIPKINSPLIGINRASKSKFERTLTAIEIFGKQINGSREGNHGKFGFPSEGLPPAAMPGGFHE